MSKIIIVVPCMEQVSALFAHSLATLKHDAKIVFQIGSLVYESREKLADEALKEDAEKVLWLDSDMYFEDDTLDRLIAHDAPIVSGVYYQRIYPYKPNVYSVLEINDNKIYWQDMTEIPEAPFIAEGVGMGCMLMDTQVLKDVREEHGKCFTPIAGIGEDLSFCLRAKACGYQILCDPTIELGHVATMIATKKIYLNSTKVNGETHGENY